MSRVTASRTGTSGLELMEDSPVSSESILDAVWLPVCGSAVSLASNRLSEDRLSIMSALAVLGVVRPHDGVSYNTHDN